MNKPHRSPATILIVDDNQQFKDQLTEILELEGFKTVVANGVGEDLMRDALRLAKQLQPHLAIIDLRLNDDILDDIKSLELLGKLADEPYYITTILLSFSFR